MLDFVEEAECAAGCYLCCKINVRSPADGLNAKHPRVEVYCHLDARSLARGYAEIGSGFAVFKKYLISYLHPFTLNSLIHKRICCHLLYIEPCASVKDRDFLVVYFNDGVVNAQSGQCRQHVLDGSDGHPSI